MRQVIVRLGAFLLLCLGVTGLRAQEVIPVSGGNASGSGGSASYTIGQIFYTTFIGSDGSLADGVQQPFEIQVLNGVEESKEMRLNYTTFPNPTNGFLTLRIDNYDLQHLSYQLYDIKGKLIENKKVSSSETHIFMGNLLAATYFLKLTDHQKEVKSFKIIKF
jgi:hypothetical protein